MGLIKVVQINWTTFTLTKIQLILRLFYTFLTKIARPFIVLLQ